MHENVKVVYNGSADTGVVAGSDNLTTADTGVVAGSDNLTSYLLGKWALFT